MEKHLKEICVYNYCENKYYYKEKQEVISSFSKPSNTPFITKIIVNKTTIKKDIFDQYDFFIQEGLKSCWFSLVEMTKEYSRFQSGELFFATAPKNKGDLVYSKTNGEYKLLLWKYKNNNYKSNLKKIDYFTFIDEVRKVKEFELENYYSELSSVDAFDGGFYLYEDKGFVCIQNKGESFFYVSYLAVFEKYRKTGVFSEILMSLFALAKTKKKDILVAVIEEKITPLYKEWGFEDIGYWIEV